MRHVAERVLGELSARPEEDGKEVLVPLEEYKQRLAEKLVNEVPTIDKLKDTWIDPDLRIGGWVRQPEPCRP